MGKFENTCRVLLVDDQEPMRLLLAQFIRQDLGAEITLAGTCEAALRLAGRNTYDVILLDLLMPGMGGFELLSRIRSDSPNKSTPWSWWGARTCRSSVPKPWAQMRSFPSRSDAAR